MEGQTHSYWLDEPLITGAPPEQAVGDPDAVVVIGSGVTGASLALFLGERGLPVVLIDYQPQTAATCRNASHILYGTVENYLTLTAMHGRQTAKELWQLSIDVCHTVRDLIQERGLEAGYRQDGYLVIATDEAEHDEVHRSIEMLRQDGFESEFIGDDELNRLGFRHTYGARFEKGSAQVHPVRLRNALVREAMAHGVRYVSGVQVTDVLEEKEGVRLEVAGAAGGLPYAAAAICANAYGPKVSSFFRDHSLVEPFCGQIIVSDPMPLGQLPRYPHSFNHGYEYAVITEDNRLLIGGWRDNVAGGELGNYDLSPRADVDKGLQDFVRRHYHLVSEPVWKYSWKGVMAASKTGLPFIGPTHSPRIYTCSGFTGHGMSWGCGSAKILADIICGEPIPPVVQKEMSPVRRS